MAHLSRPYQIALGGLVVLALAWFLVLHRPGSSPSEPQPAAPSASAPASASHAAAGEAPAPAAATKGTAPGASTPVYNGPVPGLHGLTRDIARAHGAVAASETNAAQLAQKSAQASTSQTPAASTASTPPTSGAPGAGGKLSATQAAGASSSAAASGSATASPVSKIVGGLSAGAGAASSQQAKQTTLLRGELNHGKVVLLLFWNPKATDDDATFLAAEVAAHSLKGQVSLHVALASQVSLYGSVTRNVGIFQTPTLLVIGRNGSTATLTGFTDRFTIEQAIAEARAASAHA